MIPCIILVLAVYYTFLCTALIHRDLIPNTRKELYLLFIPYYWLYLELKYVWEELE